MQVGDCNLHGASHIAVLDSPPPTIAITFPFAHARYSDPFISVSGKVDHPQIENVAIHARAGADPVDAQIAAGRFSIGDLAIVGSDRFTLTVTASHPGGDTAVETLTLSREPELTDVPKMVLDPSRSRILLVDRYTAAIIATPLDGGARTIVSGAHVGAGPALVAPVALAMDTQGDTLYVVDNELRALLRVDPVSGDRTVISSQSRGTGPLVFAPTEMDFDSIRGSIIVSDESQGVLVVDPATGDRRVLSSSTSPGPQVFFHRGIGFDLARDRYLVSDSVSLFAVNPVTGARTMLSDWLADPSFGRFFRGMSVASDSGVVFVGEEISDGVLRIDLSSGQRHQATSSGLPAPWNFRGGRFGAAAAVSQRCDLRCCTRPTPGHRRRVRRSTDGNRRQWRPHGHSQCQSRDGPALQRSVRPQVRTDAAEPLGRRLARRPHR